MKAKEITIYLAFDGTEFRSQADCRSYEAAHVVKRLAGLTVEQVEAAARRENTDLADAFEMFGNQIAIKRREAGELRRRPKGQDDAAAPTDGREYTAAVHG